MVITSKSYLLLFTTMLQYKAMFLGKQVIKIDKWFPSSKTCSCCGNIKDSLSLGDRVYNCECGHAMDRDLNASINIREVGRTLLAY
ncbi:MAG: zinc ribbon domain-containing protein [Proteocatella sp.]